MGHVVEMNRGHFPPAFEGFGGGRGLALSTEGLSLVQSLDTEVCGWSLTELEPTSPSWVNARLQWLHRGLCGTLERLLLNPSWHPVEVCPEVHVPGVQGKAGAGWRDLPGAQPASLVLRSCPQITSSHVS